MLADTPRNRPHTSAVLPRGGIMTACSPGPLAERLRGGKGDRRAQEKQNSKHSCMLQAQHHEVRLCCMERAYSSAHFASIAALATAVPTKPHAMPAREYSQNLTSRQDMRCATVKGRAPGSDGANTALGILDRSRARPA